jgi:hypothetical protein
MPGRRFRKQRIARLAEHFAQEVPQVTNDIPQSVFTEFLLAVNSLMQLAWIAGRSAKLSQ